MRRPETTSADASKARIPIARIGSARLQTERFALLVDELSAAMARASAGEIDREIKEWVRKIVLALEVDRGTFWERQPLTVASSARIGGHARGSRGSRARCYRHKYRRGLREKFSPVKPLYTQTPMSFRRKR
jgi:hypothetical protein